MRANDLFVTELQPRTSRFFDDNGQWFFRTREGIRFGGYTSRFDAELAACLLFTRVSQADSDIEARTVIAEFAHAQPMPYARSTATIEPETRLQPRVRQGTAAKALRRLLEIGATPIG